MSNDLLPPPNCVWWVAGDSTPNPPEDRDFLVALANAGFKTYISEGGLIGALSGDRQIDVIHRGFGRRWRLGFLHAGEEQSQTTIRELPNRAKAVVAWLHGNSIQDVVQLLEVSSR